MKHASLFLLSSFLLFSCIPPTQTSQTQIVRVYASSAAQPWLTELYTCAAGVEVVLIVNPDAPDIYLRLGEPEILVSAAYQIDEEEILVVTPRESPVQNLTLEEVQELFAQGNASLQVWVYSSDADVQMAFDQLVMKGRSVTSSARVAVSPQDMSNVLNSEINSIGILPRHWLVENMREEFLAGVVPVLAITKPAPQQMVTDLVSCLQNN